tara:strand:- start:485 stop:1081 length:597 start_codon:yes stop_codon:yes gene_type:complete
MIDFIDLDDSKPYKTFFNYYKKAMERNQNSVEAIVISSFDKGLDEVNSRFVNLKFIKDKEWIFFSNYLSSKARSFDSHNQISALFYWNSINVQIRIKANIKKTSSKFNNEYFKNRATNKNALAISSEQSKPIKSYDEVINSYNKILKLSKLDKCPDYWGGYSFKPFYFEFWEGHESRLNKRNVYEISGNQWKESFLQP